MDNTLSHRWNFVRRDEFSRFVELLETCHGRGIKEFQLVLWNSVASFEEENTAGRVPMDRPRRRNTYIEISFRSPRVINSSQFLYRSIYIPSVIPSSKHVSIILLLSEMRNRIWKFKTIFENFPPPLNLEADLLLQWRSFSPALLSTYLRSFRIIRNSKKRWRRRRRRSQPVSMPDRRKIFLLHLFVGQTGGTRYLSLSLSLYSFATSGGSAFKEPLIKAYPCQAWKDSFNENRDMKMGRSIYTVERSKAVPWMYLSNIYIYIPLLPFLSSFLSYLQGCFIPRIKLPRIFLYLDCHHYIDSFSFHIFFSSLLNRRYYVYFYFRVSRG